MRLFVTPSAEADLQGILDYIAAERPQTAKQVVDRIRDKCELIRRHPEIGQRRPEFAGNYRSWPVDRWVIFYRVASDSVEVHRVIDGSRDIDSLLD